MNTKLQKEIKELLKKLEIINDTNETKMTNKKSLHDYKLQTKFPTKFSNGDLTITNSTK